MDDPNINAETGETLSTRSSRFTQWVAFLVFSCITMGSAVQVKKASEPVTSAIRYAVACAIVTFIITTIVVVAQLSPVASVLFVGTKIEGVLTFVLVIFWAAIVSITTDANIGLADPEEGLNEVKNANLYFFGWAGFVTSILILVSFLRDAFGLDLASEVRDRAARLQWWGALLASSIVVMGSASQTLSADCTGSKLDQSVTYCRITKFAVAAGAIGFLLSLLVIGAKVIRYTAAESSTPFLVEVVSSIFLIILNAFNVGFATSASGPGSGIGNIYFFSWAMFLTAAAIAAECYGAFLHPPSSVNEDKQNGNGELEVETFDDAI